MIIFWGSEPKHPPLVGFNNQPLGWQLKVVTDCAKEITLTGWCTFFIKSYCVEEILT